MKKTSLFLIFFTFLLSDAGAQLFESDVYRVSPWIDGPVTLGAFATNFWGLRVVDRKGPLDSLEIIRLDPNNINAFDRSATRQDASNIYHAWHMSDLGMEGSFLLPALLMLDKDIRNDWAPVLLLYLETEAVVGNLFSWGAAIHIDRIRPLVYNPNVPFADKTYKRNKNSFYSGHTSSSAAASFFVAKVYCDYHPELGVKKFIIYGLALVPPAFTGYYRYRGMKHFPTDILTGLAVGATTGILVPHLHKDKEKNLTLVPVAGEFTGFAMSLKF